MSKRALLRTLAVLGALVVLWGGFALFQKSMSDAPVTLVLPKLTIADVDRIELTRPTDTIRLLRSAGAWTVNGHPADQSAVADFVGALADSSATSELIARSASSHGRLGVDSTGRRIVFAKGDQVLLDVVAGSDTRSYQSTYLRRDSEPEVYLYRGKLATFTNRALDQWRNRQIASVKRDDIDRIEIGHGSRTVTIARADSGWTVGHARADSAAVGRLLTALADIRAISFATPAQTDSLDFTKPRLRLTVLGHGADTLLALVADSAASGYWVRRAGSTEAYQVDFWRMNQLTPSDSALRGPAH
jgi:Domain of unknown function (DUF4340)